MKRFRRYKICIPLSGHGCPSGCPYEQCDLSRPYFHFLLLYIFYFIIVWKILINTSKTSWPCPQTAKCYILNNCINYLNFSSQLG